MDDQGFRPPAPRLTTRLPGYATPSAPAMQHPGSIYPSPADSSGRPTPVSQLPRGFAFPFPQPVQVPGQYAAPPFGAYGHPPEVDPFYNPVMQGGREKKTRPKKADGKQPTFLTKLYAGQPEYHHAGETIIIERPDELAQKVLPLVYRQSRFASFSRQLNIYGWMRKVSLRHVERGIVDPDASTWSHPFLKRDSRKEEIMGFKRRVPPRPSQAQKSMMSLQMDGLSPTSDDGGEFPSPNDPYQHLVPDFDDRAHFIDTPPPTQAQQLFPPLSASYAQYGPGLTMSPVRSVGIDYKAIDVANDPFFYPAIAVQPQSAPAVSQVYGHDYAIDRGHARTRSVQGEPPSAIITSPLSASLGTTGWPTTNSMDSPSVAPAFSPTDATTWARRGQATFGLGPPLSLAPTAGTHSREPVDFTAMRPPAAFYAYEEAAQGSGSAGPSHAWSSTAWPSRPPWHTPTKSERPDPSAPYETRHSPAGGVNFSSFRAVGGPSRVSLDSLGDGTFIAAGGTEPAGRRAVSADAAPDAGPA